MDDLNYLETRSSAVNSDSVSSFDNPYEACHNAHAIAILTEWDEFINYDWQKIYDSMQKPAFVFDGRNLLQASEMKAIGFVYQAIGS
jgi:UDPglucose 6-dehydrogenase